MMGFAGSTRPTYCSLWRLLRRAFEAAMVVGSEMDLEEERIARGADWAVGESANC